MSGVFDPSLADGRAQAELQIRGGELVATTPDGAALALPLAGLQLEIGGADGDVVFCRHPDAPGRVLHGRGGAARALLLPHVDAAGQALLERRLRDGPRPLWRPILAAAVALALVIWAIGASVGALAGMIPPSVDQELGRALKPLVLSDATGRIVTDPAVREPVQAVMAQIVAHSATPTLPFDLTVVRGETVNAFALPGGVIVVFTGLLEQIDAPDALAAVLAHEWTHVTGRHGLRKIGQSVGVVAMVELALGDVAGVLGSAVELFNLTQVQSYGRALEEESDAEAVRLLARAGWDPMAVARFFERLAETSPRSDAGALSWLSTHPSHAERVAAAKALAQSDEVAALRASSGAAIRVDWAGLRAALAR